MAPTLRLLFCGHTRRLGISLGPRTLFQLTISFHLFLQSRLFKPLLRRLSCTDRFGAFLTSLLFLCLRHARRLIGLLLQPLGFHTLPFSFRCGL